ncbi:autoinducer binding domain-containing protein (plasmid) [Arsenophonus nasoniae]|uniref:Autoinducer binding domain-containing protein n=1 Tax=Arsenophonus nasoniae TaxID=638 RepID=A0A4P7L7T1_9GAMM|nr:autoinducer binding domain-containing protein [Arsenophonus nasoniae]QBY46334.1 Transcriptional activator protein EsaR [Arsenophonus nasoniae]WGM08640.1 autoinducer binding domain-containing protein [Arsenophonus nasoniae]WGM13456.1 autoinducer binding domain-containing protein [Arsenophonus nasoniae]WGM18035.1 autoinducer binding domain-containing protein [Arsenophonus nasoniae]
MKYLTSNNQPNLFLNDKEINYVINSSLEREINKIGTLKYSYSVMDKNNPNRYFCLSNYPEEWVEIYKAESYQYVDPLIKKSLNRTLPFFWDENILINLKLTLKKIVNATKNCDCCGGHTFIFHDLNHYLARLNVIFDDQNSPELEKQIKEKLQMLLMVTHNKLIDAYTERSNEGKKATVIFSPRENEILYWVSLGKTYLEIAMILGIKTGTVKFHMSNVVKKLGVCNAKQAIRVSAELGLIKRLGGGA